MPKYAVKIGEINLVSERPITTEEQQMAVKAMKEAADELGNVGSGMALTFSPSLQGPLSRAP